MLIGLKVTGYWRIYGLKLYFLTVTVVFQRIICLSLVFVHAGDRDSCVDVNIVSSCVLLHIAGTVLLLKL